MNIPLNSLHESGMARAWVQLYIDLAFEILFAFGSQLNEVLIFRQKRHQIGIGQNTTSFLDLCFGGMNPILKCNLTRG